MQNKQNLKGFLNIAAPKAIPLVQLKIYVNHNYTTLITRNYHGIIKNKSQKD